MSRKDPRPDFMLINKNKVQRMKDFWKGNVTFHREEPPKYPENFICAGCNNRMPWPPLHCIRGRVKNVKNKVAQEPYNFWIENKGNLMGKVCSEKCWTTYIFMVT